MKMYPQFSDAVRAVWRAGNTPALRGRLVRTLAVEPQALALEVGAYVGYDAERDLYTFRPGD